MPQLLRKVQKILIGPKMCLYGLHDSFDKIMWGLYWNINIWEIQA